MICDLKKKILRKGLREPNIYTHIYNPGHRFSSQLKLFIVHANFSSHSAITVQCFTQKMGLNVHILASSYTAHGDEKGAETNT